MTDTTQGGNIVKSFKIGNTSLKICDDYCRSKTPEEVQVILNRIARRAMESLATVSVQGYEQT